MLGWHAKELPRTSIGFSHPQTSGPLASEEEPILYGPDRHLLTIAPTGAGKGRGVIIPNLLRFEGSAIVIDPKGETWHVTARRRPRDGPASLPAQSVRRGVEEGRIRLNPFDLFRRPGALLDADAEMLARGIRAIKNLGGPDVAAMIWDKIEAKRRA